MMAVQAISLDTAAAQLLDRLPSMSAISVEWVLRQFAKHEQITSEVPVRRVVRRILSVLPETSAEVLARRLLPSFFAVRDLVAHCLTSRKQCNFTAT
jgi:hypothetical protein